MARAKSAPLSATVGFETKRLLTADKRRNNMDVTEYKHVVRYGELFHSTLIPFGLWFLEKNKRAHAKRGSRDRRKEILIVNARAQNIFAVTLHPSSRN